MQTATVEQAINLLHKGGLIVYPTEAVFGLGCDPQNQSALQRLLDLKQRPAEKGLIVIASQVSQLQPYLQDVEDIYWDKAMGTWPGPYTWLFPCKPQLSSLLRGKHVTLAVRVSAHPLVRQLCDGFAGAIVSTSANIGGQPAVNRIEDLDPVICAQVDGIVPGEVDINARPTQIRDVMSDKIIRVG